MKRQAIPPPGTAGGPCTYECDHPACQTMRQIAETECEECHEPVGYGRPYFRWQREAPIHIDCLDRKVDRWR